MKKLVLIDFAWADDDQEDACVRDGAGRSVEAAIRTADLDYMPEEDAADLVERIEGALRRQDVDLWGIINADVIPWEHADYVLHATADAYLSTAHAVLVIPAEGDVTMHRGSLR